MQARAQRSRMFISFPVCLFSMYIEIECNDAGVNRSYLPFVLIARKVFNYRHHNDDEENREQKKQIVNKKSIQTIRETIFIHVFLLNCFSNSSLSLSVSVYRVHNLLLVGRCISLKTVNVAFITFETEVE